MNALGGCGGSFRASSGHKGWAGVLVAELGLVGPVDSTLLFCACIVAPS
jgi:hypothetical protein